MLAPPWAVQGHTVSGARWTHSSLGMEGREGGGHAPAMEHRGRGGRLRTTPFSPEPPEAGQRGPGSPGAGRPRGSPRSLPFGAGLQVQWAGPPRVQAPGLAGGDAAGHFSLSPACPAGLYGKDCQHSCLCLNRGTCDPVSGHCTCPEGWAGLACEEGERRAGGRRRKEGPWGLEPRASAPACLGAAPAPVAAWSWGSGSWGVACSVTSPLGTPPSQGHGIRGSGCGKQGRAGVSWAPGAGPSPVPSPAPASAECPPGFSGAGCQHVCGCLHGGLCDRHTGHCRCPAGWTGDECQSREWGGLGPLWCGLGSHQGVEASPGWATDR